MAADTEGEKPVTSMDVYVLYKVAIRQRQKRAPFLSLSRFSFCLCQDQERRRGLYGRINAERIIKC